MGSHEDQGPHAPMGDYLSADAIAERIARRAGERGVETLIAPALPFGGADYFGSMPGGISLTQPTLRAVLSDMLGCLIRHNLTRLIVINGHGGNVQAIHDATQPFWVQRQILIPSFYLWRVGYGLLPGIVGEEKAKLVSGHGADPLTSVAMHLFPAPDAPRAGARPGAVAAGDGHAGHRVRRGAVRGRGDRRARRVPRDRARRACAPATRGCARRRRAQSWSSS